MKHYEIESRKDDIPLNKTAGRFYFEKLLKQSDIENLFRDDLSDTEKKELFKKYVCIINLETNSFCNRTCNYCPLSLYSRKTNVSIDENLFTHILDDLSSIEYQSTISLNLYNEPLSDKTIFEKISKIKERLPRCFLIFNSNGDYLDKSKLKILESSGLNAINITLHTTKLNSYNDKDSVSKIDNFYNQLGICIPHYDISPNAYIHSAANFGQMSVYINTSNWERIGNSRAGSIESLSVKNREVPCVKIFREFTIDYRGRVFPCCNVFPDDIRNEKYIFGNLSTKTRGGGGHKRKYI